MKTDYYTLYTHEETVDVAQASGSEDRQFVSFTQRPVRRENNVIVLSDYLSALPQEEEFLPQAEPLPAQYAPVPRARTDHSLEHLLHMEWAACAAIICAAVAVCMAFLF